MVAFTLKFPPDGAPQFELVDLQLLQESLRLIAGPGNAIFHRCRLLLLIGTAELHRGWNFPFVDIHITSPAAISVMLISSVMMAATASAASTIADRFYPDTTRQCRDDYQHKGEFE